MEKKSAYMNTITGNNIVIAVRFYAIPEPKNIFSTWTIENENENIVINLEEGAPQNVKKYFSASKIEKIAENKYLARLEIFDIQMQEDNLDVHFQISNFLKYPDEVYHLVIRVSDGSINDVLIFCLFLIIFSFFFLGAFINVLYFLKSRLPIIKQL